MARALVAHVPGPFWLPIRSIRSPIRPGRCSDGPQLHCRLSCKVTRRPGARAASSRPFGAERTFGLPGWRSGQREEPQRRISQRIASTWGVPARSAAKGAAASRAKQRKDEGKRVWKEPCHELHHDGAGTTVRGHPGLRGQDGAVTHPPAEDQSRRRPAGGNSGRRGGCPGLPGQRGGKRRVSCLRAFLRGWPERGSARHEPWCGGGGWRETGPPGRWSRAMARSRRLPLENARVPPPADWGKGGSR